MTLDDYVKTSPVMYIVAVTILCVSHGFVYIKGREQGLERYYEYKATAEAQYESDLEEARANTVEVARLYSDYAGDLRKRGPVSRMPKRPVQTCGPHAPTGITGGPADLGFTQARPDETAQPYDFYAEYRKLEGECADTTLMLRSLQVWVIGECK